MELLHQVVYGVVVLLSACLLDFLLLPGLKKGDGTERKYGGKGSAEPAPKGISSSWRKMAATVSFKAPPC